MDKIFKNKSTEDTETSPKTKEAKRKESVSSNTEDESTTKATSSGSELGFGGSEIGSALKKSTTDTALSRHFKRSPHNNQNRPLSPPAKQFDGKRRSSTPEVKESPVLEKGYDDLGLKRVNKYTLVKEIGKGVHGKVKLCKDTESGAQYVFFFFLFHSFSFSFPFFFSLCLSLIKKHTK